MIYLPMVLKSRPVSSLRGLQLREEALFAGSRDLLDQPFTGFSQRRWHAEMVLKLFSHLHRFLVLADHLQDSFAPMLAIHNGRKMLYKDDLPHQRLARKMA